MEHNTNASFEVALIEYEAPRELLDDRLCRGCRCVVGSRVCRRGEYAGLIHPLVDPNRPLVRVRETDHIPPRLLTLDPPSRIHEALDHFAAAVGHTRRCHHVETTATDSN
ncbi:hypothetical protein [Mycobacteroides abscessus]|uniref:hypothetical protein n=1 Tax=Mycobacteroides abscessus TaxID=36809 RepID=UPI0018777DAC|nr:hypothetical protein [Mycobacteroides abscessus]MDM2085997.1 hypothetical protein [Mycobacteroides abscessus]